MTIENSPALRRRGLLLGAGAAATALASATAGAVPAAAARAQSGPGDQALASQGRVSAGRDGSPVSSTLASAPISGYTYRHVSMFDFDAEIPTAPRRWGGYGVYTEGGNALNASVEIPAGARIRDVEWYAYNNSGAPVSALARLWVPGTGTLYNTVVDASIPSGTAVTRTRVVAPAASYGPYPVGCKLYLVFNSEDNLRQVNGARVGFDQGAGMAGLLPTPVRVYDSHTTGGILAAGSTRTITLPAGVVVPGTTGVLANITAVGATAAGYLKVYPGHGAVPAASALNYPVGGAIANAMTVGVSASRQIKIYASKAVHVIVDVTGTIA